MKMKQKRSLKKRQEYQLKWSQISQEEWEKMIFMTVNLEAF